MEIKFLRLYSIWVTCIILTIIIMFVASYLDKKFYVERELKGYANFTKKTITEIKEKKEENSIEEIRKKLDLLTSEIKKLKTN